MTLKAIAALTAFSALAATSASAQSIGSQTWIPELSGVYRCVRACAGAHYIKIVQTGMDLNVSGAGQAAHAWIERPGHIGTSWNDHGVYSPNGVTIQFASGTVWVLVDPMPLHTPGV